MAHPVTADVLESPVVGLLLALEHDGFRVTVAPDGVLSISPRARLSLARMAAIVAVKDEMKILVSITADAGVHDRRDAFRAQFAAAPTGTLPPFLFKAGVVYAPGCASAAATRCPA